MDWSTTKKILRRKEYAKKKKSVKTFAMERWVFGGEKQIDKT